MYNVIDILETEWAESPMVSNRCLPLISLAEWIFNERALRCLFKSNHDKDLLPLYDLSVIEENLFEQECTLTEGINVDVL